MYEFRIPKKEFSGLIVDEVKFIKWRVRKGLFENLKYRGESMNKQISLTATNDDLCGRAVKVFLFHTSNKLI